MKWTTFGGLKRMRVGKKRKCAKLSARLLFVELLEWQLYSEAKLLNPSLQLILVPPPSKRDVRSPPIRALCQTDSAVYLLLGLRNKLGIPLCEQWAAHLYLQHALPRPISSTCGTERKCDESVSDMHTSSDSSFLYRAKHETDEADEDSLAELLKYNVSEDEDSNSSCDLRKLEYFYPADLLQPSKDNFYFSSGVTGNDRWITKTHVEIVNKEHTHLELIPTPTSCAFSRRYFDAYNDINMSNFVDYASLTPALLDIKRQQLSSSDEIYQTLQAMFGTPAAVEATMRLLNTGKCSIDLIVEKQMVSPSATLQPRAFLYKVIDVLDLKCCSHWI